MKKLALALAGALVLAAAAPAFACPNEDHANAPQTAEKDKSADKAKDKTADKAKTKAKTKDTAKDAPKKTEDKPVAKV